MTYPEFLEVLRKTKRNWSLRKHGEIRYEHSSLCPGLYLNIFDGEHSGFCWKVANSADNDRWMPGFSSEIRRDILEACGLKESA